MGLRRIKTASEVESERIAARTEAAKAECRRRILAVADETAQINIAAAAAAGELDEAQMAVFRAGLGWIAAMRGAAALIAQNDLDPREDANWPEVPEGVKSLADAF